MKLDNLKTIDQLVESNPDLFTPNKLKWLVRNRDHNGLASAIYIIAGKSYIDVPALERALTEQNAA